MNERETTCFIYRPFIDMILHYYYYRHDFSLIIRFVFFIVRLNILFFVILSLFAKMWSILSF
jgi:hypothetical protein